jgi:glycine/D-amino acid oxidase-like deaminating enzyme
VTGDIIIGDGGSGIVSLATAFRLIEVKPGLRLLLLEKDSPAATAALAIGERIASRVLRQLTRRLYRQ